MRVQIGCLSTTKLMVRGFFNVPYFVWTIIALIIAGIFVYIWPRSALIEPSTGFRYFIVHWGHTLTWLLLGISFFLRGIGSEMNGGSSFFALVAGLMYLLFIAMTFIIK